MKPVGGAALLHVWFCVTRCPRCLRPLVWKHELTQAGGPTVFPFQLHKSQTHLSYHIRCAPRRSVLGVPVASGS